MPIRIGIITVRDAGYHPNRRLLEAARAAGHQGMLIHPYRLWPKTAAGTTGDNRARLPPAPHGAAPTGRPDRRRLPGPDPPVSAHGYTADQRSCEAVSIARNKFLTQQVLTAAGLPCPDTVFVNDESGFYHAVDQLGGYPVVVKQVSERQGDGVLRIMDAERCPSTCPARIGPEPGTDGPTLPAAGESAGISVHWSSAGKCSCAASLVPPKGDFRANFHLGVTSGQRPFPTNSERPPYLLQQSWDAMWPAWT
jgi:ribosomal protein S6--L-glutamate ligase